MISNLSLSEAKDCASCLHAPVCSIKNRFREFVKDYTKAMEKLRTEYGDIDIGEIRSPSCKHYTHASWNMYRGTEEM